MKTIHVMKATAVTRGEPVDGVQINIFNSADTDDLTLEEVRALHHREAQKLFDVVYGAVPGGVFDQLLGLMLAKKASHLIISQEEATR